MIRYELGRGLAYRSIKHPDMHWYTRTIPLLFTAIGSAAVLFLPSPPIILGKDGLVAGSLSVLSTLPGFYFAGLAAVATFSGLNMDAAMPAPAPTIDVRTGIVDTKIDLSRRQFLSYLFSYLVLLSFALCVASLLIAAATPSLIEYRNELIIGGKQWVWTLLRIGGVIGYVLTASSILVTTLHGMFFLTERIHQP